MHSEELVGRDAALTVLSGALAGEADSERALLFRGERGIGKTACLAAGRAMAGTRGYVVMGTAGSAAETHLPYAGLHRLLRSTLDRWEDLPGAQRRALATALGMRRGHEGEEVNALAVCLATLQLIRDAAGDQGLLVTADDFELLDEQTRHVLGFVARRLETQHVLAATRTTGAAAMPGDTFREVPLRRLDESDSYRLLGRRAAELTRAQKVWVASLAVGNPLALLELARTAATVGTNHDDLVEGAWPLTPPLERAFARGVDQVSSEARDVLLVAAMATDPMVQEIVAATVLLRGTAVEAAVLDSLQSLGLLQVDELRIRFAHPLVRAAVVRQASISRRQSAHRALGSVITANAHRRAWHRAQGTVTHDDLVAAELEATTVESLRRGDAPAAIKALERAAELSSTPLERARRLLIAARCSAKLGTPDLFRRLLEAAIIGELSEFDQLYAELLQEGFNGVVIADSNRVMQLCHAARQAAAAGETDLALELAEAAVRRRCAAPVDGPAVRELKRLARELAGASPSGRAVSVLALADPIGHGRAVAEALATPDVTDYNAEQLSTHGVAARAIGHYATASALFDGAERGLRAHGFLQLLARNLAVCADLRLELGQWDRSAAALIGYEQLSEAAMSPSHRAAALTTSAKLTALRGDPAKALRLLSEAERLPAARSGSRFLARIQMTRGIACLCARRHDDAYVALRRVFVHTDPSHHFREQLDAVTYLVEAAAHTGRGGELSDLVEELRELADLSGSIALLADLAYADAVLATDDHAEDLFLAALSSDTGDSVWLRARLQLAYGRWLRRNYRISQSREPLQSALSVFQRLGAVVWAEEAMDELRAAGGVNVSNGPAELTVGSLSAQERKIADLVAQGLTNREIGQHLHLSPRTVSSHLYRMFPKLGVSTRAQIAMRLGRTLAVDVREPTG